MRVLGIAGSPRKGGNTDTLLARFMEGAASRGGEIKILYVCEMQISGCQHCDACLAKGQCRIQDDMQTVYRELEAADRIVVASPLHFMSVPAQLKALIDRCQAIWARKYILKVPPLGNGRQRKGYLISVGGRRTIPNLFDAELATIRIFFKTLDVNMTGELLVPGVDARGDILKYPEVLEQANLTGQKFLEDP